MSKIKDFLRNTQRWSSITVLYKRRLRVPSYFYYRYLRKKLREILFILKLRTSIFVPTVTRWKDEKRNRKFKYLTIFKVRGSTQHLSFHFTTYMGNKYDGNCDHRRLLKAKPVKIIRGSEKQMRSHGFARPKTIVFLHI